MKLYILALDQARKLVFCAMEVIIFKYGLDISALENARAVKIKTRFQVCVFTLCVPVHEKMDSYLSSLTVSICA